MKPHLVFEKFNHFQKVFQTGKFQICKLHNVTKVLDFRNLRRYSSAYVANRKFVLKNFERNALIRIQLSDLIRASIFELWLKLFEWSGSFMAQVSFQTSMDWFGNGVLCSNSVQRMKT